MRVLVTWGSKRGGTEGIGRQIAGTLNSRGYDVVAVAGERAPEPSGFDAVVVGGALYANRWSPVARRFVTRHLAQLRQVPVWLYSSGPLDDSATRATIPPAPQVAALAARVGALGHATFGGRLEPDARGFPAQAMARSRSGDWRDGAQITAWAEELAARLPHAHPGTPVALAGGSPGRLLLYATASGALLAGARAVFASWMGPTAAVVSECLVAAALAVTFAWTYFKAPGAREPLPTALLWAAATAALPAAVVPGALQRPIAAGLPAVIVLAVTWAVGQTVSMIPPSKPT